MSSVAVLPTGLPVGTTAATRITAEHRAAAVSFRRKVEIDLLPRAVRGASFGAFEPVAASVPTSAGVTYIVVLVVDETGAARRVQVYNNTGPDKTVVARYVAPIDSSIGELAKTLETATTTAAIELARDPATAARAPRLRLARLVADDARHTKRTLFEV